MARKSKREQKLEVVLQVLAKRYREESILERMQGNDYWANTLKAKESVCEMVLECLNNEPWLNNLYEYYKEVKDE